jgi:hypothetical protein
MTGKIIDCSCHREISAMKRIALVSFLAVATEFVRGYLEHRRER